MSPSTHTALSIPPTRFRFKVYEGEQKVLDKPLTTGSAISVFKEGNTGERVRVEHWPHETNGGPCETYFGTHCSIILPDGSVFQPSNTTAEVRKDGLYHTLRGPHSLNWTKYVNPKQDGQGQSGRQCAHVAAREASEVSSTSR